MKLINHNQEKVVLEMSREEFRRLRRIVSSANEEYEVLDPGMLDLDHEEVSIIDDALYRILDAILPQQEQ